MAGGPAKVKEMKSKPGNPNCTEKTSLNMAVGHCIMRELFFQCPNLNTTADACKTLITYGKACPLFPMPPKPPSGAVQKGGLPEECKNPPMTNLTECCSAYPPFDKEKAKTCFDSCKSKSVQDSGKKVTSTSKNATSPKCCMTDCIMDAYGFTKNGTFNADMAKKSVATATKDKAWTAAVSSCLSKVFCKLHLKISTVNR